MSIVIPRGFTKRNFPVRKRRKPVTRKLVRRVRNLEVSRERKVIELQFNNQASPIVPEINQMTNIAQGLTDITRLGSKITVVGIQFRYLCKDTVQQLTRIMLVQDKHTDGAIYIAADVLADVTQVDAITSLRNRNEMSRFRILYDVAHAISLTGKDSYYVSKFIKLNIPLRYDGNAGDITDLTGNSLSLMHWSEVANGSITGFWRVFFTDG